MSMLIAALMTRSTVPRIVPGRRATNSCESLCAPLAHPAAAEPDLARGEQRGRVGARIAIEDEERGLGAGGDLAERQLPVACRCRRHRGGDRSVVEAGPAQEIDLPGRRA